MMKSQIKKVQWKLRSIPSLTKPVAIVESLYRKGHVLVSWKPQTATGFSLIERGSVVVRLADFGGSFEMDARSHLFRRIVLAGTFEPEAVAAVKSVLSERKGDCVDVGANVGFYTVLFSKLISPSHRVLSVEPVPAAQHYLFNNLHQNGCDINTIVFPGALGAEEGEFSLQVIPGKEEYSSAQLAHSSVAGLETISMKVRVRTLDDVVAEFGIKPVLLKIDVEGSEFRVLSGAERTLREHRPCLLLEVVPTLLEAHGGSADMLFKLLNSLGYKVRWLSQIEVLAYPQ